MQAEVARRCGADAVVNYQTDDWVADVLKATDGRGVDLALDSVGRATLAGSIDALATFGTVVFFGFASGLPEPVSPATLIQKSRRLATGQLFQHIARPEDLQRRAGLALAGFAEGWLPVPKPEVHALADAPEAHRRLEARLTVGKLALKP